MILYPESIAGFETVHCRIHIKNENNGVILNFKSIGEVFWRIFSEKLKREMSYGHETRHQHFYWGSKSFVGNRRKSSVQVILGSHRDEVLWCNGEEGWLVHQHTNQDRLLW